MRRIFQRFDTNNDGTIDEEELQEVRKHMEVCLSQQEVDRIIKLMDTNQDGVINYEEFLDYYKQQSSA